MDESTVISDALKGEFEMIRHAPRQSPITVLSIFMLGLCVGAAAAEGVTITSPADGAIVRPGDQVTVNVEVDRAITPERVIIMAPSPYEDVWIEDTVAPFTATFTIPKPLTGPLEIRALLRRADSLETPRLSPPVTIDVVPAVTPTSIRASVSHYLNLHDMTMDTISVVGSYADGVERDISGSALGTTYQSNEPTVASVDAEGIVRAHAVGTAAITVANGGRVAYVMVYITELEEENPPTLEVTASVSISGGGFRRDPKTRFAVQEVTIRNISDQPLALPLSLVISDLPQGVRIEGAVGTTRVIVPSGSAAARVAVEDGGVRDCHCFPPGGTGTATLEFSDHDGRPITYTARLFSGRRI